MDTSTGEIQVTGRSRLMKVSAIRREHESAEGNGPTIDTGPGMSDIPEDLRFIIAYWTQLSVETRENILVKVKSALQ